MKGAMLGFLAETSIHSGAGRSAGIVDLPVAREAATDFPFVAGSGLKGAMRDAFRERSRELGGQPPPVDIEAPFGAQDRAGQLLVSDARLILLPVRSMTGAYRWVTCPQLLERYRRDLARCGCALPEVPISSPGEFQALAADAAGSTLYLEELQFEVKGPCPGPILEALGALVCHEETRARLRKQVVVLGDDDFAWFCRSALPIQARNVLDEKTKTTKNLWYEESLPPDTVMYAVVMARDEAALGALDVLFPGGSPYLQLGGNETVGSGWMAVTVRRGGVA
jgi:CRISPR-associated protein Cmr4